MNEQNNILDQLSAIGEEFKEAFDKLRNERESYWNSLTQEQQIDCFCAVSERIYQAEIVEGRSYRGTLYSIFGFGPEAYAQAQMAHYLDIHNAITTPEQELMLLEKFATHCFGIEPTKAKEMAAGFLGGKM